MPVETNPLGIRPVGRPQTPSSTEGVSRREDSSSSGFTPRTDVSIKNAVDNMAGILSKISTNEQEGLQKLPEDLQKVIQNVMRQAFSMEETLSLGIGSTLESQRFSMEQLAAFSRMLSQFGALAEKGFSMEISDQLQSLLTNLKSALTQQEGGSVLEPVLLNKIAFELLDTKNVEDLPQVLAQVLSQLQAGGSGAAQQGPQGESSAFDFLKQMVRYFMPRPAEGESAPPQQSQQPQQGQAQQGSTPQGAPQQSAAQQGAPQQGAAQPQTSQQGTANPQGAPQNSSQAQQGQGAPQGQPGAGAQPSQSAPAPQGSSQQGAGMPGQGNAQGNAAGGNASPQGTGQPFAQNAPQGTLQQQGAQYPQGTQQQGMPQYPQGTQQQGMPQYPQQQGAQQQQGMPQYPQQQGPQQQQGMPQYTQQQGPQQQGMPQYPQQQGAQQQGMPQYPQQQGAQQQGMPQYTQQQASQQAQMMEARAQLLQQPLQNTPQTMNAMKDLAQFLLKDSSLSQQDAAMLQNFVNGKESIMNENEARHLQNLLRLCQQNVPTTVQQAAIQQNLPDLPRLWAFMQLCDMAFAKQLKARELKRAGKDVADFVASMRHSMGGENSSVQGQKSLNFMMPLYLGENENSYPAYIHVYDENARDPETNISKKETWLRICLLTDNIGAVELTFRVYDGQNLDMRLFFSDRDTAEEFREYIPELKDSLKETPLQLGDLKVGAVGERRFI